ncbi:MAG: UvrD-helicase domain-containing protein [Firmicutes bacterium]|nr:UvrD-helicase domain-containing protein [Bacillota bacterium]
MVVPSPNEDQQRVIGARAHDLLIEADAGTGKTATLVWRLEQRLHEQYVREGQVDLRRFVLLTFTDAAAAQMRERVAADLALQAMQKPGEGFGEALAQLDQAPIETIDAFCRRLVAEHPLALDVSPAVTVVDPLALSLLREEVADRVVIDALNTPTRAEETLWLARAYGNPYDTRNPLRNLLLEASEKLDVLPDPQRWLREQVAQLDLADEAALLQSPWVLWLQEEAVRTLRDGAARLSAMADTLGGYDLYRDFLREEAQQLLLRAEALPKAAHFEERFASWKWRNWPQNRSHDPQVDVAKELRNSVKKQVQAIFGQMIVGFGSAALLSQFATLHHHAVAFARLLTTYRGRFQEAKREHGWVDFADLERGALQLLQDPQTQQPTPLARRFQCSLVEVMVDEYQDINPLQDTLIGLLTGEERAVSRQATLLVVGDVKQSIYRFRMADPQRFLQRKERYRFSVDAAFLTLSENHRSRPELLQALNGLFAALFVPGLSGERYDPTAHLRPAASYPPADDPPIELLLVRSEPDVQEEEESDFPLSSQGSGGEGLGYLHHIEQQVAAVAPRLQNWVGRLPVTIDGVQRPLAWRDIAVLIANANQVMASVLQMMNRFGLPAVGRANDGFFRTDEVRTFLALLRAIDNPYRSIDLAAALHSPIGRFDAADLAQVRLAAAEAPLYEALRQTAQQGDALGQRSAAFVQRLTRWRQASRQMPLPRFVRELADESGWSDAVAARRQGQQRRANLERLFQIVETGAQTATVSLSGLVQMLSRYRERADLGEATDFGNADAMRVMTMHQAKGLEFPVVIVLNLQRSFRGDANGVFGIDPLIGLGMQQVDVTQGLRYETLPNLRFRQALQRAHRAEALRLFYVAATRARERLVLVGSIHDLSKATKQWASPMVAEGEQLSEALMLGQLEGFRSAGYLDWIGPYVIRHPDGSGLAAINQGAAPTSWSKPLGHWSVAVVDAPPLREPPSPPVDWEKVAAGTWQPEESAELAPLHEALDWAYPYGRPDLPAVISVSEVKRQLDQAGEQELSDRPADAEAGWVSPSKLETPSFVRADTVPSAVAIGSAVHAVFAAMPLADPTEAGVRACITDLVKRGRLTLQEAVGVDVSAIVAFWASALGARARRATLLRRELPFLLRLTEQELQDAVVLQLLRQERSPSPEGVLEKMKSTNAEERQHVLRDPKGSPLLLRGIIDLLWQESDGFVVVDYKTDRVDTPAFRAQAVARYRPQLALYARAVQGILQAPVKEGYLYFTRLKENQRVL